MAVTLLDPRTALIVVDLQKGIMGLPTAHPSNEVAERAAALAKAFRAKNLPVVLVNVTGGAPGRAEQSRAFNPPADWAELIPQLEAAPSDHRVTKRTWGAFTNTDLEAFLKAEGVTQVVICGVATSIGVESTARYAHELGFNITLALDAMTDMSLEAHDNSVGRIFPRLGETGTTADVLAKLTADAG